MQAVYRSLLVAALCVAVSVFMVAGISHAKGGSHISKVKVHVRANLEPCGAVTPATSPCDPASTPPEPNAEGKVWRHKEARKGVTKKDEFKGVVKIPVDSASALGIVDETSAENADIRVILSRNGADYAECRLELEEIEEDEEEDGDDEGVQAHYRVHVRIKKGAAIAKKGTCDINPTTAAIDLGVPDVQAGDLATVTVVTDPNNRGADIDFLDGDFETP